MTAIVIDPSMVAGFLLPDEKSPEAEATLSHLTRGEAAVPSIFWHELRNLLLMAQRRKRIDESEIPTFMTRVRKFTIADLGAGDDSEILRLAKRYSLTAYDAAYLALAAQRSLPLATLDGGLRKAAPVENVLLFATRI